MPRPRLTLLPATLAVAVGAAAVGTTRPLVRVDSAALTSNSALVRSVLSESPHGGRGVVADLGSYFDECDDRTYSKADPPYLKMADPQDGHPKIGARGSDGRSAPDVDDDEAQALVAKFSN